MDKKQIFKDTTISKLYWRPALAKVSYEFGSACALVRLSACLFATQDFRIDSSVFSDFCMKLHSYAVRKVMDPTFSKKGFGQVRRT